MKSSRRQRVRLAASRAAGRNEPPPAEGVHWRLFACRPSHWQAGCLGGAGRSVADRGSQKRRDRACPRRPHLPTLCFLRRRGAGLLAGGACQTGAGGLCYTARTNRPAHLSRLGGGSRFWLRRLDHRRARGVAGRAVATPSPAAPGSVACLRGCRTIWQDLGF